MEDLQEIADVLGVIYQDDCKAEKLTIYPAEVPNSINFEDIIERIEANDPTLTEVTLNNVKNLHSNQWLRLFTALEQANTVLETLHAANCNLKDIEANMIVKAWSLEFLYRNAPICGFALRPLLLCHNSDDLFKAFIV